VGLGVPEAEERRPHRPDPDDDHRGDFWDHVAFDPESKLVLAVVPGARTQASTRVIVAEVEQRVNGDPPPLMTGDEDPADATAIAAVFSVPVPAPPRRGSSRGDRVSCPSGGCPTT